MRQSPILRLLDLLLVTLVMTICLSAVVQVLSGRPWGWIGIHGDSMSPAIRDGSLVLALPASGAPIRPGAIVVFRSDEGPRILCHRVVSYSSGGYVTRGDACSSTDQQAGLTPVAGPDVLGYVPQIWGRPVVIPLLGSLTSLAAPDGGGFVVILGVSFGLITLSGRGKTRRSHRTRPR